MMGRPHTMAAADYISPETVPGATAVDAVKAKTLFGQG
jgi:hypothetical protein